MENSPTPPPIKDSPTPPPIEDSNKSSQYNSAQIESAITDALNLVTYTSKAGIEVDEKLLATLIDAKTIWDAGDWSTEFAVQFWEAFREMNQLIKPATVASVNMICMEEERKGFKGFIQRQYGRSEADRTITRNTIWTLGILIIVLIFQIYWVIGNSLTLKLTELLNAEKEIAALIDKANLDHSEIEVRFKLAEQEGADSQGSDEYDFYVSPDWERETLLVKAERQNLEEQLEALKGQLDRNSTILLLWSAGWNWIIENNEEINTQTNPQIETNKALIADLDRQILEEQALINDAEVQKEIDAKQAEVDALEAEMVALEAELPLLVTQAQTQETADDSPENESGPLQAIFEQTVVEINKIQADIDLKEAWLNQTDLDKIIKAQRQTTLDNTKAEKAALERQIRRDVIKELSHRVRLSTEFMLLILQSYVLPVLYGLLGASVYVLRTLTREITDVTYSGDRGHLLRLALGTLSGLIIGWFVFLLPGQSVLTSISPLALSFLVGYNIEIVFSLMDRLIGAFTKPPEEDKNGSAASDTDQTNGEGQPGSESPAVA
jgi:hypothetical protein